jgi:c-di-GMP-binding flagellar brake protein YcgR
MKQRKHPRVPASLPCTIKDEAGQESPFELIDLSEAGARIRCPAALKAMTEIRVAILLPATRVGRDDDVRLDNRGVVVWSHAVGDQFDTGVFFPEIDAVTKNALQAYVASAAV